MEGKLDSYPKTTLIMDKLKIAVILLLFASYAFTLLYFLK